MSSVFVDSIKKKGLYFFVFVYKQYRSEKGQSSVDGSLTIKLKDCKTNIWIALDATSV